MANHSKLREWREARSLSAAAFAGMIESSSASVIRLEQGKQSPSFDLLKRIHEATGGAVTPNDFLPASEPAAAAE